VIGVAHHSQEVLRRIARDLGALLDQRERFFRRGFIGPLARHLGPADDRAQCVCNFVRNARSEVCSGRFGLDAFRDRAFLQSD
jgi:hypothetical protein